MSDQAHSKLVQVLAKERREYLRKKVRAYMPVGFLAVAVAALIYCVILIVSAKVNAFNHPDPPPCWYEFSLFMSRYTQNRPEGFAPTAGRIALLIVTALLCCVLCGRKVKEVGGIAFVPRD